MLNGSGLVVLQSSDHFNAGASARVAAQHAVSPRAAVAVKGYVERVRMHRHNLRTLFISLGHDAGSGLVSIADVANGLRHAGLAPSPDVWALLESALRHEAEEDAQCPCGYIEYSHFIAAFHRLGAERRFARRAERTTAAAVSASLGADFAPPQQALFMRVLRERLRCHYEGSETHTIRSLYMRCAHEADGSVTASSVREGIESVLGLALDAEQLGWLFEDARAAGEVCRVSHSASTAASAAPTPRSRSMRCPSPASSPCSRWRKRLRGAGSRW